MVNVDQVGESLRISFFTVTGDIQIKEIPIPKDQQFIWVECEEDDPQASKKIRAFNGKFVKKLGKKYLNKYRKLELLCSLPQSIKDVIHSSNQPKKYYWDIETESVNGEFASEETADGRVLTNSFCDDMGNTYGMGLKELSPAQVVRIEEKINEYVSKIKDKSILPKGGFKFQYKYFDSEKIMLAEFCQRYARKMPCITGWNIKKYDMRYFVNRCKRLKVNHKMMSPVDNTYTVILKDKYNREIKYPVELPMHKGVIDYLEIYEKFDSSQKFKTSSNLDFVALTSKFAYRE
jgi:hypothetical protein